LDGFRDCNGGASDGCEADLNAPTTCGACDVACDTGDLCSAGACTNDCPAMTRRCGGSCVDVSSSRLHCGACGAVCPMPPSGTSVCVGGMCAIGACSGSWADCNMDPSDGCETGLLGDPRHCGSCENSCASGRCSAGTCAPMTALCTDGNVARTYMYGSGICTATCGGDTIRCIGTTCDCIGPGGDMANCPAATCTEAIVSWCCLRLPAR